MLLVWRMPATLFSMPDGATETLGFFVVSVAMAWSMVWLLGHWLGTRYRSVTFFLILGVMMAIGLLSYYCHFADAGGLAPSHDRLRHHCVRILPLAMMLASYFCRTELLSAAVPRLAVGVDRLRRSLGTDVALCRDSDDGRSAWAAWHLVFMLIFMVIGSVVCAGVLYLLNLPFLELAFRCPFYRERFEKLFRIEKTPEVVPGCPFAEQGAVVTGRKVMQHSFSGRRHVGPGSAAKPPCRRLLNDVASHI